jgi:hypothetical protein
VSPVTCQAANSNQTGAICWRSEGLGISRGSPLYFAPDRGFARPQGERPATEPTAQQLGVTMLQAAKLHGLPLRQVRHLFVWGVGDRGAPIGQRDAFGVAYAEREELRKALGPRQADRAKPVAGFVEAAEAKRDALRAKMQRRASQ